MCINCYREAGSPWNPTAAAQEAAKLALRVYEGSDVGGNCHIVLDDNNLEDAHIRWVLEEGIPHNHHELAAEELASERACMEAYLKLPMDERWTAQAICHGYCR